MYTRGTGERRLIAGVYVDDLIITGGNLDVLGQFKAEMKRLFKMSDLGALSYYLGIEVHQSAAGISISQGAYAEKILELAGMLECNPCLHLTKTGATPGIDATSYRSIVGSLRYLVNTWPDLAYSVGYVSRFMEAPREEHMTAVKRILRYIAGTINWGVFYEEGQPTVSSGLQ